MQKQSRGKQLNYECEELYQKSKIEKKKYNINDI